MNNNSSNDPSNISSFYRKFHQLKKLLEEDLTSDSSSLFSSHSDESSCGTNSSSDSTSTDDLPEYFYSSDSGCGWNGLQTPSDVDASLPSSSSSSPLLHPGDSRQCGAGGAKTTEQPQPNYTNGISNLSSRRECNGREKTACLMEGKDGVWLHSDPSRQCSNVMSNG